LSEAENVDVTVLSAGPDYIYFEGVFAPLSVCYLWCILAFSIFSDFRKE